VGSLGEGVVFLWWWFAFFFLDRLVLLLVGVVCFFLGGWCLFGWFCVFFLSFFCFVFWGGCVGEAVGVQYPVSRR